MGSKLVPLWGYLVGSSKKTTKWGYNRAHGSGLGFRVWGSGYQGLGVFGIVEGNT